MKNPDIPLESIPLIGIAGGIVVWWTSSPWDIPYLFPWVVYVAFAVTPASAFALTRHGPPVRAPSVLFIAWYAFHVVMLSLGFCGILFLFAMIKLVLSWQTAVCFGLILAAIEMRILVVAVKKSRQERSQYNTSEGVRQPEDGSPKPSR